MARQLLNTTALIDFSKGFEPSTACIQQMLATGDEVGVCPVTVAEVYSGLHPNRHQDWDAFLSNLLFWRSATRHRFKPVDGATPSPVVAFRSR